jgi:AcrR family transcriptional regulator
MNDLSATIHPKGRLDSRRRRQLILDTTFVVLSEHGAEDASLRLVCREMGVSPSLITHFYSGWHELLAVTNDMIVDRFLIRLRTVVTEHYSSERFRMDAIIRHYVAADWLGRNTISALMALWQMARSIPALHTAFDRFLSERNAILHECVEALADETGKRVPIEETTISFLLILDGIWLQMSQASEPISERYAIRLAWCCLAARFDRPDWIPAGEMLPPKLVMAPFGQESLQCGR